MSADSDLLLVGIIERLSEPGSFIFSMFCSLLSHQWMNKDFVVLLYVAYWLEKSDITTIRNLIKIFIQAEQEVFRLHETYL